MNSPRILFNISQKNPKFLSLCSLSYSHIDSHLITSQHRLISSTAPVSSWMDSIKGVFTGKKAETEDTPESFTLLNGMKNARRVGSLKQFVVGRSSEATFSSAFEKQEAIIRYLGALDPTGENLQTSQKQEAAKHCNCTIADVESTLSKFIWAKEAQNKMQKLKEEGKPMPKNMAEVQKLMGSTPLDLARSNLAKSGQISKNALCPCGSKKKYKRVFHQPKHCIIRVNSEGVTKNDLPEILQLFASQQAHAANCAVERNEEIGRSNGRGALKACGRYGRFSKDRRKDLQSQILIHFLLARGVRLD
ncbi:hypothetical protein POTOM_045098 [Populus tomentosa]|uniref:Uncharacterized protein n=1 Tax=Populus tomentosa TaxID=118781 RepID=A0A8X7YIC0_POPTO|nr:hypothetical protein POTOM_045098 [Populus tomentosa]